MKKKIENKLAKIGLPSAYVTITALVVTLICNTLGV